MNKILPLIVLASLLGTTPAMADSAPLVFESDAQEQRFNELTAELRCLVCQNQSLADSDAELAADLRQEVFDMMQTGRSNDEIKSFLVERYGDFVLYRPPVQGNTLALWLMPFVLLVIGAVVLLIAIRKRRGNAVASDS